MQLSGVQLLVFIDGGLNNCLVMDASAKQDVRNQLQNLILQRQGFKKPVAGALPRSGLGSIESAFPYQTFPLGAVHEFISPHPEHAAATSAFMAGLVGNLTGYPVATHTLGLAPTPPSGHSCVWLGTRRSVFPSALTAFHRAPEHIIFIDLKDEKHALWAVEEALACPALTVVVAEITELTFTQSRRLQLAVEKSQVTGFIHRRWPRAENTVACVSRWKIAPLPSLVLDELPGLGFPAWQVQLARVRNGTPGQWNVAWVNGRFVNITHLNHHADPDWRPLRQAGS